MLKKLKYKEVTWLDLESPTAEELEAVGKEYDIHPLVLSELAGPSERSKVDIYNDLIYLILHFPIGKGQEINFVISPNVIITTHYQMINSLNDFSKIFETDFLLRKNNSDKLHAGFVFFHIIREIYSTLESGLSVLNRRLRAVEEKVFSGHEREVVKTLSDINRELIDYQWTMRSHREILSSLELAGEEMFGPKFRYYLQAVSGANQRIWKIVENNRSTFNDLRETNESLLTIKTNETMKVLTVVALIFLPLNLIAQIFGVAPDKLNLTLGFLAVALIITATIVKQKKWL